MPEDPYADPATGVLRNKLDLRTTRELETAEREITHAALIFLKEAFCLPQYIESSAAEVFRGLHGESLLRGLTRDAFTERLTYFLGEINAIHSFREGNGRAQRVFLEQLAREAGFILDWQHLDAERNIAASAAIMRGDPAPMKKMLAELIREP